MKKLIHTSTDTSVRYAHTQAAVRRGKAATNKMTNK